MSRPLTSWLCERHTASLGFLVARGATGPLKIRDEVRRLSERIWHGISMAAKFSC